MSLAAGRPRPLLNAYSLGGYELFHVIRFLGYLFLAATCASAVALWYADRRAQDYRQVGASARSFMVVPLGMRDELYAEHGRVWVRRFRQSFRSRRTHTLPCSAYSSSLMLYAEHGRVWVRRFRQSFRLMIGCFIVAALLITL